MAISGADPTINASMHTVEEAIDTAAANLTSLTSDIVAAYVSHNSVQPTGLAELIASVHASLAGLGKPSAPIEAAAERVSASEIRKSIRADALISFVDGKPYKTLKRHLAKAGMTPDDYRAKYGLPHDYPMVAASYAEQRSQLARSFGLGQVRRKGGAPTEAAAAEALDQMTETPAEGTGAEILEPKKRGRKPAAAKAATTAAVKAEPAIAKRSVGRPRKVKAEA